MAERRLLLTCRRSLMLFGLCITMSAATRAQVSFIQITDPHIFDDAYEATDNRLDDKAAFASCLDKINQKAADGGARYEFVVVTGDMGIAGLLQGVDENDRDAVAARLRKGAADLASMLILSKVGRWLFVPGDNDLVGEVPGNIRYYHQFIEALGDAMKESRGDFEIKDLCPKDDSAPDDQYDSRAAIFKTGDYAFIGFDDTSFKNDPKADGPARINSNFDLQRRHVRHVRDLLSDPGVTHAYIFYHIPEVDDPHYVTLQQGDEALKARDSYMGLTGGPYERSAWFVRKEVRDEWNQVVTNEKVIALFAGHFHDPQRKTYQGFEWMSTPSYLREIRMKLHINPPLALKFQGPGAEQARGFQEVYIDKDGAVSTRIFWLERAGWNPGPETAAADDESLRQLELGRAYESLGRLKEAEAAYAKAAENQWQPTRERAIDSLSKVVARQDSFFEKHIRAPLSAAWVAGVTALGTALPVAALIVLFGIPYYYITKWLGERAGKEQLKIGPIVDSPKGAMGASFEQVAAMIHGRMRIHYKPRGPFFGPKTKLPMLIRSQSAEVGSLIEAVVPGGLGKFIAWLRLKKDRPRYSIEGVVQTDQLSQHAIFISLSDAGEPLKIWDESGVAPPAVVAHYKYIASKALRHLVRHMNP